MTEQPTYIFSTVLKEKNEEREHKNCAVYVGMSIDLLLSELLLYHEIASTVKGA